MKQTLANRILKYLRNHQGEWINGQTIGDVAHNCEKHYKHETAGRTCRLLAEQGLIEREEKKGQRVSSVWYRYVNKQPTIRIIERDGKRVAQVI